MKYKCVCPCGARLTVRFDGPADLEPEYLCIFCQKPIDINTLVPVPPEPPMPPRKPGQTHLSHDEKFKRAEVQYNPNLVALARQITNLNLLETKDLQLILFDLGIEFQIAPAPEVTFIQQ